MNIVHAFSTGFRRATSAPKMVFILYLVNLILAIPLALAFRSALIAGFGDSLAPRQLMANLDFTVFQDFMNIHSANLQIVLDQLLSVLVLSMLLQTFLAGGILTVLQDEGREYSTSSFFKGCGAYFFRFFRLFLLFGVILLVTAFAVGAIVIALARGMTENATSELTELWIRLAAIKLFFLPLMLVVMAADYAKIHIVLRDEHSAVRACGKGFVFVFRRFISAFGLQILMLIVPVVFVALYIAIDLAIGMTTGMTILLMFLIQQLFMMLRAWTKVLFFAGEMTLYRGLERKPFPEIDTAVVTPGFEKA